MADNLVRVDHDSLKVLSQVLQFSQAPVLLTDNKWSQDPTITLKDCYPLPILNQHRSDILPPSRISIKMMLGYLRDY